MISLARSISKHQGNKSVKNMMLILSLSLSWHDLGKEKEEKKTEGDERLMCPKISFLLLLLLPWMLLVVNVLGIWASSPEFVFFTCHQMHAIEMHRKSICLATFNARILLSTDVYVNSCVWPLTFYDVSVIHGLIPSHRRRNAPKINNDG